MKRYAIYFTPPDHSALWRFGSSVLGFDAATFMDVEYPEHPLFHDPAAIGWTAAPRLYGFHATLKAPFRLAPGTTPEELGTAAREFAAKRQPFEIELKLATLGDFLALVPVEPSADLDRLADDCVRAFEAFRAPLTPEDRERRHPELLTPRQLEQLDRWGYPFVFDDLRFHMSLTGPLGADEQQRVGAALRELFEVISPRVTVDAVSVCIQDERNGRFRVLDRLPFRGEEPSA